MNKNKQAYDRPTCDVLVIQFEGAILTASQTGNVSLSSWTQESEENDLYFE